jgi:ribonuclease VapC
LKNLTFATIEGRVVEASMVMEYSPGYEGLRDFDLWMAAAGIELAAVDADRAPIARQAFRQFGKGRHRAALNFGDCFSYALAKATGFPLLFEGVGGSRMRVASIQNTNAHLSLVQKELEPR